MTLTKRTLFYIMCSVLLAGGNALAGVPRTVPPLEDTLLRDFLKSLDDHLNTLECLTANPNGSVLGVHGEIKCANYGGSHYLCMNTGTGPAKTTTWMCLNMAVDTSATSYFFGAFCPGALSTSPTMACEKFRPRLPAPCILSRTDAAVTTTPAGASIIVDILECSAPNTCTSIWNATPANRLTITAGSLTATQSSFDDTSLATGNYAAIDITQVGSTTAGSQLTVTVTCQ